MDWFDGRDGLDCWNNFVYSKLIDIQIYFIKLPKVCWLGKVCCKRPGWGMDEFGGLLSLIKKNDFS